MSAPWTPGITYFDTAASYGDGKSETNLGRVLKELNAWPRVVVGTKVRLRGDGSPRAEIREALEQSLRRLDHDSVDVFHLHNPIVHERGLELDAVLGEVARGFEDVIAAGMTRHAGFTALGQTSALVDVARATPYETLQVFFNVLNPSAGFPGRSGGQQDFGGLIETAASAGRGVIVIRVLAAGAAAATPERVRNAGDLGGPLAGGGGFDENVERARKLAPLAQEAGLEGPVELALRFGLSKAGRLNRAGRLLQPRPPRGRHPLGRARPAPIRPRRAHRRPGLNAAHEVVADVGDQALARRRRRSPGWADDQALDTLIGVATRDVQVHVHGRRDADLHLAQLGWARIVVRGLAQSVQDALRAVVVEPIAVPAVCLLDGPRSAPGERPPTTSSGPGCWIGRG